MSFADQKRIGSDPNFADAAVLALGAAQLRKSDELFMKRKQLESILASYPGEGWILGCSLSL